MPLSKQALEIPLGQGLQTDVDPKLLPVGKSTQLENCLWTQSGEITKRPGSVAVGGSYVTGGTPGVMPPPWQLAQHKGSTVTLSQAGVRPIGVYSPAMDKWQAAPPTSDDGTTGVTSKLRGPLIVSRTPVFRPNTTVGSSTKVSSTDMASDGTLVLDAWIQDIPGTGGTPTIQARFIELSTGNVLFTYEIGTNVSNPRCVYTNGIFTLLWQFTSASDIEEVHWSSADILAGNGAISSGTVVATPPAGVPVDVIANGNNVLLIFGAAASPSGKTMAAQYAAGAPGAVTTVELLTTGSARIPPVSLGWVRDLGGSGKIAHVSIATFGVIVYWDVNLATGVAALAYTVEATSFPSGVFTLAAHTYSSDATGEFEVVYQTNVQPAPLNIAGRLASSGAFHQLWLNSTSLMSHAFAHNGDFYVLIAYESQIQGTYFAIRVPTQPFDTVDFTQAPSARYATDEGNGSDRTLTSVVPVAANQLLASAVVRTHLNSLPGVIKQFDLGIDLLTLTFNPATSNGREYAGSLYVTGGVLGAFDGSVFAEDGFHVYPEAPTVNQTGGGSMTALAEYEVCQVYRYTDNNGQLRRSNPSEPTIVTLTGGNQSLSIVGKTLKLTGRPGMVAIETYITTPNESSLFFLIDVSANVETADTHTITYGQADVATASGEELYTTGGVIGNGPPPSTLAIALFNGRLAVVSPDDPTLVRISMPLVDGHGPTFDIDGESSVRVDDSHGNIVGLGAMDDKLLIFKADAVYMINGTGPDATGNGTWGVPQFVCIGTGCTNPRSICEVPDGVMFQSTSTKSGTYLINRGLALGYIGAPVQAYLADQIVDVVHVPVRNRTMFYSPSGRTQVYDWAQSKLTQQNIWTTNINQAASCAGLLNGLPLYQAVGITSLELLREDATGTVWDEAGTPNDEYVLSPWLSLNGLKGYERFYQLQGVGKTVAPHLLTLTMWVNFNDATPYSTTSIQIGGPGPTADWNAWEFKHPNKSTSVRFGIRCSRTPGDHSDGAGANMSALVIIYGAKAGLRKIAAANRTT